MTEASAGAAAAGTICAVGQRGGTTNGPRHGGPFPHSRDPAAGMSEPCFDGVVWTDAEGYAEVTLPHYAPAVAARFRYELTPMRPHARAVVAAELAGSRFTIQTDEPHVKVAWRLVPLPADRLVATTFTKEER